MPNKDELVITPKTRKPRHRDTLVRLTRIYSSGRVGIDVVTRKDIAVEFLRKAQDFPGSKIIIEPVQDQD